MEGLSSSCTAATPILAGVLLFPEFHASVTLCLPDTLLQDHDAFLGCGELFHLLAEQLLQPLEHLDIILGDEGDGFAGTLGTRRSTHAMNVGLRIGGNIKVDDTIHLWQIETATHDIRRATTLLQQATNIPTGYIGGDENVSATRRELIQGTETFGLTHLAVQGDGGKAEVSQEQSNPLRRRTG